ncbi:MAG: hypothetical protein GY782_03630 [Gammaproteobacteria bacterium]|nr:hypothetical protein [Gammaproteobacteria bacterium]
MAYTNEQLMQKLRNAHNAGDTYAAKRFAEMIRTNDTPAEPEPEPGILDSIGNMFTGADRETRATKELPELESAIFGGDAAGFLSTMPTGDAVKLAGVLAITDDPNERANMLKAASPDFGIQYDEKGNVIAANNKTGQRVILNKPGVSASDLLSTGGRVAASIPLAATGGTPLAAAAAMGAKEGAITAAQEGLQASQGGNFDAGNVIADMALGGMSEFIPSFIGRMKDKSAGQAERLTQEAIDAEAGRITSDLSPEAQAANMTEQIAKQSQARLPREKKAKEIAGQVMPDMGVIEAAERVGVADELTPGMVSKSETYKDIEGAIRAMGGNQVSAQGNEAIKKIAQSADDLITDFGGVTDKAALSREIKDKTLSTIGDLDSATSDAYSKVNELVSPTQKVDMSSIVSELTSQANQLGGVKYLEPFERRILGIAKSKKPNAIGSSSLYSSKSPSTASYALVDKERKKIGAALQKKQGAYKDMDTGRLKRMYGLLTDSQGANLSDEALEAWNVAKGLTSQRKQLEEQSIQMFGKDLSDAFMPKVGGALKSLSKGDYGKFDRLMKSLPDREVREKVILSALNDVFTQGSRRENQLSIPGFVDWYESMRKQPELMRRISDNLPQGANDRLKDIFTVTKAMRDANSRVVKTGIAQTTLKDLDKAEGMLSKIFQVGQKVAAAEGATTLAGVPGAGTTGVLASTLAHQGKKSAVESADKLIASPEFKRMAIELAKSNFKATQATKAAEKALKKSKAYDRWFKSLPTEDRLRVIRAGLVAYLGGNTEQSNQQ